jgi:hypothetical protein
LEDGSWTVSFTDGATIDINGFLITESNVQTRGANKLEDGTIVDLEAFKITLPDGSVVYFSPIKITLSGEVSLLFPPPDLKGFLNPFCHCFTLEDGTVYNTSGGITRPNGLEIGADGVVLTDGEYSFI